MKNISILVDTDVILDWIWKREPFVADSEKIINYCFDNSITGYLAAHSITNIFYNLRKTHSVKDRRDLIKLLCTKIKIVSINSEKLLLAIADEQTADFEDALQIQCAISQNADYIVTRNVKDFANSAILPLSPVDFLDEITRLTKTMPQ
ncbi:MAG: PIN domain-containing protein [Firmicutes bacterium]|nr:PIN domain-containing protein [Bacillota bacterium]